MFLGKRYDNDRETLEEVQSELETLLKEYEVKIVEVKHYEDYTDFILEKSSLQKREVMEKMRVENLTDRFSLVERNARFPRPDGGARKIKEKTLALRRNAYLIYPILLYIIGITLLIILFSNFHKINVLTLKIPQFILDYFQL